MRTQDPRGKSLIVIKHVRLGDHHASVCLEDGFWLALKEIAAAEGCSMAALIRRIDSERRERLHKNLSSATRLFILDYYRSRCALSNPTPVRQSELSCGDVTVTDLGLTALNPPS